MKALILCNVDFCAWPVHLAERLARRQPGFEADALVSLDKGIADALRAQVIFRFGQIDSVTDHEDSWLGQPDRAALHERLAERFGAGVLEEIALAERELSGDHLAGASFHWTPLRRASRDPERRRAYVAGLVDWLDRLLERGGYDLVVAYSLQDGLSAAASHLAPRHGARFLSLKAIGFGAFNSLFDDPRNMSPTFRDRLRAMRERPDDFARDIETGRLALGRFRQRPTAPDYMESPINQAAPWPPMIDSAALLWRMMTRRPPENIRYPFPGSRLWHDWRRPLTARIRQNSTAWARLNDLADQPFLYFPLHYEPEASLLVSAPQAIDQVAVIERLAPALPDGWVLAVKEHRPMLGRRPAGYDRRLEALPGVRLLSPFESSFDCMKAARLTATITGSAGMESVLLGRPTLFFGDQPIQIIGEGCIRANWRDPMEQAIATALAQPPASEESLAMFLAALASGSVAIPSSEIWGGFPAIGFDLVGQQKEAVDRLASLIFEACARG